MYKRILGFVGVAAMVLLMASCLTSRFIGPTDYTNFKGDKVKSSTQVSALTDDMKTVNTYDDEFTYDDKGNIIKTKTTEYIDRLSSDKKFIVWETESKVIGGNLVPFRVSANGVPFIEIEYDILTVKGDGAVTEDISERNFLHVFSSLWSGSSYYTFNISQSNYSVPFKADSKFVKEVRRYEPYAGTYLENVVTLGYDNIVLKRFHYSREKLTEGIAKSYTGYNSDSEMAKKLAKGVNIDYTYEWQAIADRVCEKKMTYQSKLVKLEATEEYNSAGKRTKETWMVSDPSDEGQKPIKLFEQNLTY